ncbi:hypothetical protein DPMN_178465 [Dreissena polymorpha]|uniref:Uncharacterized protein n=1 Tax=Dreissena polymorpha TaxID=45954 RepID=A0A9D4EDF5_DREPO|nr:hypothetical protein DPMN_178465 [Dreissena polymorpha]
MALSKQLTNAGVRVDDETHPLHSTPSEMIRKHPILYSLLTMTDEEIKTKYRSRENDAAANFMAQPSQQCSNDSTGSTSTTTSNKRKAIANSDGQTVKKPKRNAKQDAISTEKKHEDFFEEYLKKQEILKSSHGKAQIKIDSLNKALRYVKSVPIDEPRLTSCVTTAATNISNAIDLIISNHLKAAAKSTTADYANLKAIHLECSARSVGTGFVV